MVDPERARVALITGAGQGIGAAIAERFAREGVFVLVAGRTRDKLEREVERLASTGGRAAVLELDLAAGAALTAQLARGLDASSAPGPVDWLVNNAGVAESAPLLPRAGDGADHDDLFERHMEINFQGARRLTEALLPGMTERGHGRVINLASSAALRGYAYVSAYCASKHALLGYMRSAACELRAKGVAISTVCPHYVDTPMLEASVAQVVAKTGRSQEEARAYFAGQNPGGQLVTTEQVADAVFGLATSESNGVVLELDGSSKPRIIERMTKEETMGLASIHPDGWKAPRGYSNGMLADPGGRPLFIAGQVAWDAEQKIVGRDDFGRQFAQALQNVVAVVEQAGGQPTDIARLTLYVTDKQLYIDHLPAIGEAYRASMGRHYPAMALVQVAALLEDGALIEIEADAILY